MKSNFLPKVKKIKVPEIFVKTNIPEKEPKDPCLCIVVTREHPCTKHLQEKVINIQKLCRIFTNSFCLVFG
jgi:hypothetical protein